MLELIDFKVRRTTYDFPEKVKSDTGLQGKLKVAVPSEAVIEIVKGLALIALRQ